MGCPAPPETESSNQGAGGGSTGGGSTTTLDNISPSTPTALAATSVLPSQVRLGWSASTDNVGVTGYRVYRNGSVLATQGNVTTYQDASVSPSTSYSYTVQALDAASNTSGQSTALILATPAAPDTTAPTAPTGLAASVVSASRIDLSWAASNDNVAVTGYRIFQNGAPLVTLGNVTSYQDTSVFAAATFVYTVRALDEAGNASALSAAASATTPTGPDTAAPSTPTGLLANATSPTIVSLTWSASTDNVAISGYRVYRDGVMLAILASVTTYQDNNSVTPSTTYSYNVDAVDAAGNVSGLSTAVAVTTPAAPDTVAPSTPAGLTATAVSASRINLSWMAATDNVDVTGYRIFRNGTLLTTVGNVTTYANTGLPASTTFSYAVRALDAAGNVSGLSGSASATTQVVPDTVSPTTPTGLVATPASSSQIDLSWNAASDNVAVTGYRIYRNSAFLIALAAVTAFADPGLAASTTYSYRVEAVDAAGNASALSSSAVATTQASGGTPGTPSIISVSGTISHGGSVTIAGTAFGTKSHAGPMLWDHFDDAASGSVDGREPVIHQGGLSSYGDWSVLTVGPGSKPGIVRDASSPKARSTYHARSVFVGSSNYWAQAFIIPYSGFTTGNELYISFYYRYTKKSASFGRQTKAWIAYPATGSDKAYWTNSFGTCQVPDAWRVHRTEDAQETYPGLGAQEIDGEWVRFESYLKQSGPGVANGAWHQTVYRPSLGTPAKYVVTLDNYKMRNTSDEWVDWVFGGAYYSACNSTDAMDIDVDEFYVDSTRARVEVCDTATWSARRRCELQVPTAWSDASITATFNKGYLPSATAYVYVINAAGNVNAAGHAVTILP